MKRSEINAAIREMEQMAAQNGIHLPPFCSYTPAQWQKKGHEFDEIRDNMLGWDVTDYGTGDFNRIGFALITLRNGNLHRSKYRKTYAEKLLYLREGQVSPMHFHWNKMEDIINRGGGDVLIRLYASSRADEGKFSNAPVTVRCDGQEITVPAGTQITLHPGESISIHPYLYHDFEVAPGTGAVLLGEVSTVNDDNNDNRFYELCDRFPTIEEDEPPYRLLCGEYPSAHAAEEIIARNPNDRVDEGRADDYA